MRRTQRLGRYHLTDRIAYGGMAEIYRGFTYDADGFRRDVAIKKLLPYYVEDTEFIDMVVDEYRLVTHLRHPNIAEVYELVQVEEAVFIAMEYVDGKDLRSTVEKSARRGQPLPLDDIVYIMARALDGLHHAHMARDEDREPLRIVHRDFSPSNILIAYDGTVRICDFGIAKATRTRSETKTGVIKGKVKYMSPEQASGRKVDRRSDVFSAGSVLYELCTREAPFQANNEIDLIYAVRNADPKPVQQLNPQVPDELAQIIDKAMARSRSARFQTAMEFRDGLLRFLQKHNPKHRRTQLSRFMRRLWAKEIDKDLRSLEDFVLDLSDDERDYGKNLIADALGPNAVYSEFHPEPTRTRSPKEFPPDQVHRAATALIEAPSDDKRPETGERTAASRRFPDSDTEK